MKIRIFAAKDMKKLIFFIVFFLLTGANSTVTSFSLNDDNTAVEMPLEETKDVLEEEDDDDAGLEHFWHSRETSSDSNLHFLYQEILFHDLDLEIAVPPPKA